MLVNDIGVIQTALGDMRAGQAKTICELALITLSEPGLSDTLPMLRERVSVLERRLSGAAAAPVPSVSRAVDLPAVPEAPAPEAAPVDEPAPATAREEMPAGGEPVPETQAPASEEQAVPAADAGADLWDRLRDRFSGSFPVGLAAILSDPMQVSGSYDGAEHLTLTIQPGFASNMVDRPDVTAKIAAMARDLTGKPVSVRTTAPGAAQEAPSSSKLDELRRFDIVKFK